MYMFEFSTEVEFIHGVHQSWKMILQDGKISFCEILKIDPSHAMNDFISNAMKNEIESFEIFLGGIWLMVR